MKKAKNFFLVACFLLLGCLRFPRGEAKAKAQMLEDKGNHYKAEQIRKESSEKSEIDFSDETFEKELQNDPYYFPEYKIPENKRNYEIKYSSYQVTK